MAFKLLARTRETTATTGTGPIVLVGPTAQCDPFSDGLANGDTTFAMVVSDDGVAWEEGFYTYASAGNELTRTAIIRNNTGGTSAINLAGGRVFGMIPADLSLLFDKLFAATRGTLLRRGSAAWEALAPGTPTQVLTMGANDPAWAAAGGGLPTIAAATLLANATGSPATAAETSLTAILDAAIGSTRGAILYRGAAGWAIRTPGTDGKVLTSAGAGADPDWEEPGSPAPGSGLRALYQESGTLSAPPTIAGTGLTTWVNQGSNAVITDTASGIFLRDYISAGAFSVRGRIKTAPATPYTRTMLLAGFGLGNGSFFGLGWTDGTKMHIFGPNLNAGAWSWLSSKCNSPTSYNSNDAVGGTVLPFPNMVWLQMTDDGTNFIFKYSYDGVTFTQHQSTVKSGSFLGSSGFVNELVFVCPQGGPSVFTMLSYA